MINPINSVSKASIRKTQEPVSTFRVVISWGRENIYTSKAYYSRELARGYIQGIRSQLRTTAGIMQLSRQIGKVLHKDLDYQVGVIERFV